MEIEVLENPGQVARRAAAYVAKAARDAVRARGQFVVGFSGGHTPEAMFRHLARENVPWSDVQVVQVDERIAPAGHPDRNLLQLQRWLVTGSTLEKKQVHAMPVESDDLEAAARRYASTLQTLSGKPAVLDLVHLGLGTDGHTASLVPGDAALAVEHSDVTVTGPYQGWRRMTLTYPAINRARQILWMVTGSGKSTALSMLRAGDTQIPAGRVRRGHALLLTDTPVHRTGLFPPFKEN